MKIQVKRPPPCGIGGRYLGTCDAKSSTVKEAGGMSFPCPNRRSQKFKEHGSIGKVGGTLHDLYLLHVGTYRYLTRPSLHSSIIRY